LHFDSLHLQFGGAHIGQSRAKRFFQRSCSAVKMHLRNPATNGQGSVITDAVQTIGLGLTKLSGQYEREFVGFHRGVYFVGLSWLSMKYHAYAIITARDSAGNNF
jgi:hypothetical protein